MTTSPSRRLPRWRLAASGALSLVLGAGLCTTGCASGPETAPGACTGCPSDCLCEHCTGRSDVCRQCNGGAAAEISSH